MPLPPLAEAQLQQFLEKVRQLNAFVALTETDPALRQALRDCEHHHQVVALAGHSGFEIGRRWGEPQQPEVAATNLLIQPCPPQGAESCSVLVRGKGWRLERIHSCAATTATDQWYDQADHEWITLVQGSALLQFADEPVARPLRQGDWMVIPPHRRHRVAATDPFPGSVWLALFWSASCAG